MKFTSDIDIDVADRSQVLALIEHTVAAQRRRGFLQRHNTGIYVTPIPRDTLNGHAALEYSVAEQRGYVKLDLLNVWVYKHVRDEQHLAELMAEPKWAQLRDREYFQRLIHLGRHYDTMRAMPEAIDSIARMAMFLSVIRPAKRHLIGQTWREVSKTVWQRSDEGYWFKKAHAISYAHLVAVHMNLLDQGLGHSLDQGDATPLDSLSGDVVHASSGTV